MGSVAAIVAWNGNAGLPQTLASLQRCEAIGAIAAVVPSGMTAASPANLATLNVSSLWSKQAILDSLRWFSGCGADSMLVIAAGAPVLHTEGLRRMVTSMRDTRASLVYGDYYDVQQDNSARMHPLIDYQPGSIRDSFDFGPAILINGFYTGDIQRAIDKTTPNLVYGGPYDLRLRLSERAPIYRLPEPLYSCLNSSGSSHDSSHFAYVDPRNRDYQLEMEPPSGYVESTRKSANISLRSDTQVDVLFGVKFQASNPTGTPTVKASSVTPISGRATSGAAGTAMVVTVIAVVMGLGLILGFVSSGRR